MFYQITLTEENADEIRQLLYLSLFFNTYHIVTKKGNERPAISPLANTKNIVITLMPTEDDREEIAMTVLTNICTASICFQECEQVSLTFTSSEVIIKIEKPQYSKGPLEVRLLLTNYIQENQQDLEDEITLQTEMALEQDWN